VAILKALLELADGEVPSSHLGLLLYPEYDTVIRYLSQSPEVSHKYHLLFVWKASLADVARVRFAELVLCKQGRKINAEDYGGSCGRRVENGS
jgi:hypothetical protein